MTSTSTAAPVEDLVRSLYRLGMVQRDIARQAMAELGSQGFVALGVVHRDGPVRISDVARALAVDLSVASRQVAALAKAGYVRREADEDDRRAQRVSVTDDGRRVLAESHRRMVERFAAALHGWAADDVGALAAGLDRLRADFEAGKAETQETQTP
ncbi:MarR family winged helix-turn-helix transcriptional regulator [Conexibacter sp. SYSU D00693]|uniref:MarR family winged helix-turn-helix transcriptional regulator n=1 Tax=Conexibacter sp. SYSU D00693 TaxID=2812560 RepID=UPI00196AB152|nr:MarR family transcriptional regulator [Conexibacter sp. SYSU D00693]